jgi:hypothetical protein
MDPINVLDVRPIAGLGLHLDLPGAAEKIHVVDEITAQRRLKGLEDAVQRHAQDLRFVTIDVEVD